MRKLVARPKKAKTPGEFGARVVVREIQYVVGNEATLDQPKQRSCKIEGAFARDESLAGCHNGPGDHLNRNPPVWAQLLGDELGRKLGTQEADVENRLPIVVIVGIQMEIREHVIRQSLHDISSIQLKSEEREADPSAYSVVELRKSVSEQFRKGHSVLESKWH